MSFEEAVLRLLDDLNSSYLTISEASLPILSTLPLQSLTKIGAVRNYCLELLSADVNSKPFTSTSHDDNSLNAVKRTLLATLMCELLLQKLMTEIISEGDDRSATDSTDVVAATAIELREFIRVYRMDLDSDIVRSALVERSTYPLDQNSSATRGLLIYFGQMIGDVEVMVGSCSLSIRISNINFNMMICDFRPLYFLTR